MQSTLSQDEINRRMDGIERAMQRGHANLEQRMSSIPLRQGATGGGGGGYHWLGDVPVLPAIPTSAGKYECRWISAGAGTGDDKVWTANSGDTTWTPATHLSSLSGEVV